MEEAKKYWNEKYWVRRKVQVRLIDGLESTFRKAKKIVLKRKKV